MAATLLVPGTICWNCVATSVLWPLSARGDRARGPSCASSTSLVQTLAAFQGSVQAHPARVITLAISAQAKGSKAPHRSGFQVEKVHHLLTAVTTSWECTGEAQALKEPWINGTSTQSTNSWPERGCVSRQLFSSSHLFEHLRASFSPVCSSTGFCGPVPHTWGSNSGCCISRVQRLK